MSDEVRKEYKELDKDQQAAVDAVKDAGQAFLDAIEAGGGDDRCRALAKTNAEQAVMWAVKAITA